MKNENLKKGGITVTALALLGKDPTSSVLGTVLTQVLAAYDARQECMRREAFQNLLNEVAVLSEEDGDVFPKLVEALESAELGPWESLWRYFEELRGALDSASYPFIAKLMAPYFAHGRARDRWFRKAARLLSEADKPTIEQLVSLFVAVRDGLHTLEYENQPGTTIQIQQAGIGTPPLGTGELEDGKWVPSKPVPQTGESHLMLLWEVQGRAKGAWHTPCEIRLALQALDDAGLTTEATTRTQGRPVVVFGGDECDGLFKLIKLFASGPAVAQPQGVSRTG